MKTKHAKQIRYLISSGIGAVLEWYDFVVFAYLAPFIASNFFPAEQRAVSLLQTYSAFALAYLVRPIGAILFSYVGNRFGRKNSFLITFLLMSFATFFIGLLPTIHTVGMLAPVFLLLLRMMQGIAAGGEIGVASVYLFELSEPKQRGFNCSAIWACSGIGMTLASAIVLLLTIIFKPVQLTAWVWRIPFLITIFTAFIGFFLRRRLAETKQLYEMPTFSKNYFFALLPKIIFISVLFSFSAIMTYLVFVFLPTYINSLAHQSLLNVAVISTTIILASTILVPFFGYVSDKIINRKKMMLIGAVILIVAAIPLYKFTLSYNLMGISIGFALFVLLAAIYQGPLTAFSIEQLAPQSRLSVFAIAYNLGYCIVGGTAPVIALFFMQHYDITLFPAYYIMVFGIVVILFLLKLFKKLT